MIKDFDALMETFKSNEHIQEILMNSISYIKITDDEELENYISK